MDISLFSLTKTRLVVALLLATFMCLAHEPDIELDKDLKRVVEQRSVEVIELSKSRDVMAAIRSQNKQNLAIEEVQKRDQLWQEAQLDEARQSMLDRDAQKIIERFVLKRKAVFSEIIITDKMGANVASYPLSSDYWQGDEDKFTKPMMSKRVNYGPVEHDKSTDAHAMQISVPVRDGEDIIGILIAGVRLSYAQARSQGY